MNPYIQWALYTVASGCVSALLMGAIFLIRGGIGKAEQFVDSHLPPSQAASVDAFLETVDHLAENAVQDFNTALVSDMKSKGAFTKELGQSVKKDAIDAVMNNLGPLKDQFGAELVALEPLIGGYIEKHVRLAKGQTSTNAKTPA